MARFILPTLALVGAAIAQCDGPSITISSDADAMTIQNCQKYNGDVIIDSSVSGTINLNGVSQIAGDLKCENAMSLNTINADQLGTIAGTFDLQNLTTLSTLSFSSLTRVNKINWIGLPALQALNFPQGIRESNNVYISNTELNDLNGIELTQVASMDVNNNPYLNTINVNGLTNITDALSFSANGMNLDVSFPNLQGAGNLTFRNVSSIDVPSLSEVGGAIGLYSDYFLNFSAPNLSTVGQSLAIIDCPQLNMISFPELTYIGGGFIIVNNTNLKAIDNLPNLKTIAGAIDFVGTFDAVDINAVRDVRGGATVTTSSQNQTICDLFNKAASRSVIKGSNKCQVNTATDQTNGSSTSSGSSSSSNAAVALGYDAAAPFTGLLGFIAWMLFL